MNEATAVYGALTQIEALALELATKGESCPYRALISGITGKISDQTKIIRDAMAKVAVVTPSTGE